MTLLNYPKKIRHCAVAMTGQYGAAGAKASWLQGAAYRVSPADLPMVAQHANKYAKQLGRLAAAVALGDESQAKRILPTILSSFSAKFICVLRGMGTDVTKTGSNCKMAITVASSVSPWSCTEPVLVDVQPKSGGGVRYICSFGPRRRALQIPVGKSTWWDGVKSGRYPKPVKLGPRITAWRVEDIRALIEGASNEHRSPSSSASRPICESGHRSRSRIPLS